MTAVRHQQTTGHRQMGRWSAEFILGWNSPDLVQTCQDNHKKNNTLPWCCASM